MFQIFLVNDFRTAIEEVSGLYNFQTVLIQPSKPSDRLEKAVYPRKKWDGESYPIPEDQLGEYPDPRKNGVHFLVFFIIWFIEFFDPFVGFFFLFICKWYFMLYVE